HICGWIGEWQATYLKHRVVEVS
ncbi:hypothetical protein A2U01_0096484, partial [Trifolium medium]|nr:hypothetical protein [Trifolium medium]